jgi:hypothetical protein
MTYFHRKNGHLQVVIHIEDFNNTGHTQKNGGVLKI